MTNQKKTINDVCVLATLRGYACKLDLPAGFISYTKRRVTVFNRRGYSVLLVAIADKVEDCIYIKPNARVWDISSDDGHGSISALPEYDVLLQCYLGAIECNMYETDADLQTKNIRAFLSWFNARYETDIQARRTASSFCFYKSSWLGGRDFSGAVARFKFDAK